MPPPHFACLEYVPQAALDFARLNDSEREILAAYIDICGASNDAPLNEALDHFLGQYDSERDAAESIVSEALDSAGLNLPFWLVTDFDATWRCNLRHDYSSGDYAGSFWVFCN
jgi:hypothetical protein